MPQKFVWCVGGWLRVNLVINFGYSLALAKPTKLFEIGELFGNYVNFDLVMGMYFNQKDA